MSDPPRAIRDMSIPLTQGTIALIDEEDLPLVEGKKWFAVRARTGLIYAHHTAWEGRNVTIRMHRIIAGAMRGQIVDHINGCGIDNRRANLRICTPQQNAWNRRKHGGASHYLGVALSSTGNRWVANISVDGRLQFLGSFLSPEDAARAYDRVAKETRGEFASLNFGPPA